MSETALLSVRGAVICALAFLTGIAAGGLTYAARRRLAESVLAGATATGAAIVFFSQLIST
jgi:hypothetical protein